MYRRETRIDSLAKKSVILTPLERRIMRVLWSSGPANVQKVLQGLSEEPQLAYTTVQTTLNVLHRKGKVKRKLIGRSYEYSALVSQETADSHALKDILQKVFRGSVDDLLLSLVRSKHLDVKKLAELQAKLKASDEREEKE
jgi:BlaI family transcriptional regulator, penicillinase repressor